MTEQVGGWRRLHNTELHNLYSSPNIIKVIKLRMIKWVGYIARMGDMRNVYKILVGKAEGKRPLGRPSRRWEENIRMDLGKVWTGCMWLRIGTSGGLL
jgi:hypothetical protein